MDSRSRDQRKMTELVIQLSHSIFKIFHWEFLPLHHFVDVQSNVLEDITHLLIVFG